MSDSNETRPTMRTLRFHDYGEPADVLRLEEAEIPSPGPGRIRVRVHACGLNPADWALCRGLFQDKLPRGIGLDVSGTVDAIGAGVTGVAVDDRILGAADYAGCASAGASDYAVMEHWAHVPATLDMVEAASLPMAVETACRSLDLLGELSGRTLLVHGAGTMMGFAAVQMALMRGAHVIATAGDTFAERLRVLGATVTFYGDGMIERVREIAQGAPDLILDCSPVRGVLPDLVKIAGGDPQRVLTMVDFAAAKEFGVRGNLEGDNALRYDAFDEFAKLAAAKRFTVPVAQTFALQEWRTALDISLSWKARGKLVILPGNISSE